MLLVLLFTDISLSFFFKNNQSVVEGEVFQFCVGITPGNSSILQNGFAEVFVYTHPGTAMGMYACMHVCMYTRK